MSRQRRCSSVSKRAAAAHYRRALQAELGRMGGAVVPDAGHLPHVAGLLAHAEHAHGTGRRSFTHNGLSFRLAVSSIGRLIVSDEHGRDLVATFLVA